MVRAFLCWAAWDPSRGSPDAHSGRSAPTRPCDESDGCRLACRTLPPSVARPGGGALVAPARGWAGRNSAPPRDGRERGAASRDGREIASLWLCSICCDLARSARPGGCTIAATVFMMAITLSSSISGRKYDASIDDACFVGTSHGGLTVHLVACCAAEAQLSTRRSRPAC